MKTFSVVYEISGRAEATIKAKNLEEAKKKAEKFDVIPNSDSLIEWNFEEVEDVKEDE